MNKNHIVTIALATLALSSIGCAGEEPKPQNSTPLGAAEEPILTSTVTPAEPEPIRVELPKPAAVNEEPKPLEAHAEPSVETIDGLTIQRFVTTSEIVEREPVASASIFGPDDERVYAFVEVSNESESDKTLFVHFIGPKGKVTGGIALEIPASVPRWRTWAYTRNFDAPGSWRVEIRDDEGRLVGALPFEVDSGL